MCRLVASEVVIPVPWHGEKESGAYNYAIVCSHSLLTSSRIKGVNCVECKLLHCECRASRGVDYQTMPLECIVFFGSICSQHAICLILVSINARLKSDSNDSRIMCISCKTRIL